MDVSGPSFPGVRDIRKLLTSQLGGEVRELAPLGEGMWSRAFSFEAGRRQWVIRLGDHEEDFLKDEVAASWHQPGLPVPAFLTMGKAFDGYFAVTERAHGRFLDRLPPSDATQTLHSLVEVLDALGQVPVPDHTGFGNWNGDREGEHDSWKSVVLTVETRRPPVSGWRAGLDEWPEIARTFDLGMATLHRLADGIPEHRDVVHRDWLNRNVLVTDTRITSVLDWGSSIYGDHLYDIAWLTFCASYSLGFDRRLVRAFLKKHSVAGGIDPDDFENRVDCYELHIGLSALIYRAALRRRDEAQYLAGKIRTTLADRRG